MRTVMSRIVVMFVLAMALVAGRASAAVEYVAATWSDNSVHLLDASLNSIGSFPTGGDLPNGIASDGTTIYTAHFVGATVRAFDFAGNPLFSWSSASLTGAQGLELVNGELAVADAATSTIAFLDPATGAFIRDIPSQGSTVEGIAYDGKYLWQLGDSLHATDPSDGSVAFSITNAASGESFGGTGIAAKGSDLVLAGAGGNWYKVSKADGSVLDSGNNGLDMFGLKGVQRGVVVVPIPAAGWMGLILLGGVALRRVRRA